MFKMFKFPPVALFLLPAGDIQDFVLPENRNQDLLLLTVMLPTMYLQVVNAIKVSALLQGYIQ